MSQPDWISVKELARIQGVTERAIRKSISNKKFVTREVDGEKGLKYEILVHSLNSATQNLIDFEKCKLEIDKKGGPTLRKVEIVPPHAKRIALARYDLVKNWREYICNQKSKTQANKEFLALYNQEKLYSVIFQSIGQVSIGTLYRWEKALKTKDDYKVLVPDYNYGEKEHNANLTKNEELVFMNLLLDPSQKSIGKATKLTKFLLNKKGLDSPTSERNFRRFADNFKRRHYDRWILMREGQKALKDKVITYINRDISKLNVGDVLVADGHRIAVMTINPFTGKPCRATLVGYLDWKSNALVGYEIMIEENTQCVASALRNAIINLGKYPIIAYQDNGKAFKNKFFKGDLEECGLSGLFANLEIIPVYANPYNARAKVIERFFKEFQEGFEKLIPSFVGASIDKRPAYLKRNEKFHKKHHNEYVPTIDELKNMIESWMEYHNSQPCPNVKGKTIGEVFEAGKGDGVDINKLDDLMLAQEIKTINQNGIRFLKADYYNEELYGLKERVIVKYSLFDLSHIKVYNLKGKYLCDAQRVVPVHPMANYLGDVKDVEELKQKTKQQKRLEKKTIKEVKDYLRLENISLQNWEYSKQATQIQPIKQIEMKNDIVPIISESIENNAAVFDYQYERYEWLLKQHDLSEEDKNWIKIYQNSEEYTQIYGGENEESIC